MDLSDFHQKVYIICFQIEEIARKLGTALQLGEGALKEWTKDKKSPEAAGTDVNANASEETKVKQPLDDRQVMEPLPQEAKAKNMFEPQREPDPGLEAQTPIPTPGPSRAGAATASLVDANIAPTPDIPPTPTPVPAFPPTGEAEEEPDRPPPTPTFHPAPGEPMLQRRAQDLPNLPTPFGASSIPPLPFKLGGRTLPPVAGQTPNLDNLPNPPGDELPPTYEEVEMADKLSGKKKKKKDKHKDREPQAELAPL